MRAFFGGRRRPPASAQPAITVATYAGRPVPPRPDQRRCLPRRRRRLQRGAGDREAAARDAARRAGRGHGHHPHIAATHQLTPSRLPACSRRSRPTCSGGPTGPLLTGGQRVEFAGSQLVWEYYPGEGIQLQVLGSFGKADGLYTARPRRYPAMEQLLAEIIPLASQRGGGLAWEYYFPFDGGAPPWTSAMSQATGLEALTRAYQATRNPLPPGGNPGPADLQHPRRRPASRPDARRHAFHPVHVHAARRRSSTRSCRR